MAMSYKLKILADVTKVYIYPFIVDHQCVVCGTQLGSHLHSMKRHIERIHPILANEIKDAFDAKLPPYFDSFDPKDSKYRKADRGSVVIDNRSKQTDKSSEAIDNLIKMFLTTPISVTTLGNQSFRELMSLIDGLTLPTVPEFTSMMKSHVQATILVLVTEIIFNDLYFSVLVDISVEPTSRRNYLGVTLSYYSFESNSVRTGAIDFVNCEAKSSIEVRAVVMNLITDLNLPTNRLLRIVAGGGRSNNFVFRNVPIDGDNEANDKVNGSASAMDQLANALANETNTDSTIDVTRLGDREFDAYISMLQRSENSDISLDSGIDGEYITCAVYRLQKIIENVFERFDALKVIRIRVQQLLASFAQTPEAMDKLQSDGTASLIFPSQRQWFAMEKPFQRVIEINKALTNICFVYKFTTFSENDLQLMTFANAILQPFNQYMKVLTRPSMPTISLLFTGLLHLINTLQRVSLRNTKLPFNIKNFITDCCDEIKTQFSDVFYPENPNYDPLFLAASALDATVARFLLKNVNLKCVNDALLKCINLFNLGDTTIEDIKPHELSNPFGFGDDVPQRAASTNTSNAEKEIEYLIYLIQNEKWISNSAFDLFESYSLPTLQKLATVLSSIPVSTASVDRLFSTMHNYDVDRPSRSANDILKVRTIGAFNMDLS